MVKLPEHMTLRPASLAGIRIEVPTRSTSGGRNLHVHEFAQAEEWYVEDLGRKAQRFNIDAVLIGADYKSRLSQLEAVFDKPGAVEYIDPWGVTTRVHIESWERSTAKTELGKEVIRLGLVKDGAAAQPGVVTDTGYVVNNRADTAAQSIIEWFGDSFTVEADPARLGATPLADLDALVSNLSSLARLSTAPSVSVAGMLSRLASFQAGSYGLLRQPLSLASQAKGLIGDTLGLSSSGLVRYNAARTLATGYGSDFETIQPTTATRRAELSNRNALVDLVRGLALVEQARSSADVNWIVRDEAEASRSELTSGLETLAAKAPDETFASLIDLRAGVVDDITTRALDLSRLSTFTPQAHMPALLVAHRLYGDAGREGEIVARNRPLMPGYLSAGQSLTVMADAGGER